MAYRQYQFVVKDPRGVQLFQISAMYSAKWQLNLNATSVLTMELPSRHCRINPGSYGADDFDEDYRIEIWRTNPQGVRKMEADAPFMVTLSRSSQDEEGSRIVYIEAETPTGQLDRRSNPYDAEDGRSDLGALPCDSQAKFVMLNNFGPAASSHVFAPGYAPDGTRTPISAFIAIEPDIAASTPQFQGDIENATILEVMKRISDYSFAQGEAFFFDIVQPNPHGQFQFRTYIGARGTDRRQSVLGPAAIVLSTHDDSISEYELTFQWGDTVNRLYAAGEGSGAARPYTVHDSPTLAADLAANPFALREAFLSENSDDPADIQVAAEAEFQAKRKFTDASGKIGEGSTHQYGEAWDFGDRLNVFIEGTLLDVFVSSVKVELEDGEESIDASFTTDLNKAASGIGVVFQEMAAYRRRFRQMNAFENVL